MLDAPDWPVRLAPLMLSRYQRNRWSDPAGNTARGKRSLQRLLQRVSRNQWIGNDALVAPIFRLSQNY